MPQHLGPKFEFRGPTAIQGNREVERKFQPLYGSIRVMFNESGIADEIGNGLWAEWASTASFMSIYSIIYENRRNNKATQ
jgi:hypothetical protein